MALVMTSPKEPSGAFGTCRSGSPQMPKRWFQQRNKSMYGVCIYIYRERERAKPQLGIQCSTQILELVTKRGLTRLVPTRVQLRLCNYHTAPVDSHAVVYVQLLPWCSAFVVESSSWVSLSMAWYVQLCPDAPCMPYMPTLTPQTTPM